MRRLLPVLLLALAAPAAAHNTYEAAELEVHVLDDEGSDVIESYGGYDVQDAFVGFAHDPTVGAGPAGDGVYVRLELYGDRNEAAVPQMAANWSVAVTLRAGNASVTAGLWTTDGATFASTFDSLLVTPEGRDTHVQRAFLSYARLGIRPGDPVAVERVESRVDGDLRDVAPGGIPVPGTGGDQEYPEPTALPGEGRLVESLPARAPDGYVNASATSPRPGVYDVVVRSALKSGGQHAHPQAVDMQGWSLEVTRAGELGPHDAVTFSLVADDPSGAPPATVDVLTDVGGRARLWVDAEGLHGPTGLLAARVAPPPVESPAAGPLLVLALLALAAAASRNGSPKRR